MKNALSIAVRIVTVLCWPIAITSAGYVGSVFNDQGQLKEAGQAFNGLADVTFRLFDAEAGGVQIGGDVALIDLDIVDGLLTADLDFGPDVFPGADRWVEILVGDTVLAPRPQTIVSRTSNDATDPLPRPHDRTTRPSTVANG